MARHPLGARSAKWMANPPPRCQPDYPRTLLPSQSGTLNAMPRALETMEVILGVSWARRPEKIAKRMAPASCWASWADALPMISERLPEVAVRRRPISFAMAFESRGNVFHGFATSRCSPDFSERCSEVAPPFAQRVRSDARSNGTSQSSLRRSGCSARLKIESGHAAKLEQPFATM